MPLARGLENDPPVVLTMSSLVGLRRCMLASIAIQAVSGAASTCALHDLRVDMFSPVRRRFSSATGKSDVTEVGHVAAQRFVLLWSRLSPHGTTGAAYLARVVVSKEHVVTRPTATSLHCHW